MTYGVCTKIYKGKPIPRITQGRSHTYPLAALAVGECFYVPEEKEGSLRTLVWRANKKRDGKRFIVRREPDQIGCWRIK